MCSDYNATRRKTQQFETSQKFAPNFLNFFDIAN